MKFLIGIFFIVITMAGCTNNENERSAPTVDVGGMLANQPDNGEAAPAFIPEIDRLPRLTHLTQAHFLEDLDYLLYVLTNNFSHFDTSLRLRDFDINETIENIRNEILFNPDLDVDEFAFLLQYNFMPITHNLIFQPLPLSSHAWITELGLTHWPTWFSVGSRQRLLLPQVMEFYNMIPPGVSIEEFYLEAQRREFYETPAEEMIENISEWLYRSAFFGLDMFGLLDDLFQSIRDKDFDLYYTFVEQMVEYWAAQPPLQMSTPDHSVAYVAIISDQSDALNAGLQRDFFTFLTQIEHYDHLILDTRFYTGDNQREFIQLLIEPFIDQPITVGGYVFTARGMYARDYGHTEDSMLVNDWGRVETDAEHISPVQHILMFHDLPELNVNDMERMASGFPVEVRLNPRTHYPNFTTEPAFRGNIWLLTDERQMGYSQIGPWVAKETGMFTLVGETTGGNIGGHRTFLTLPNSGIAFMFSVQYVTDSRGRTLEEGIEPHYFNRPGLDALETVLEMIREGYRPGG